MKGCNGVSAGQPLSTRACRPEHERLYFHLVEARGRSRALASCALPWLAAAADFQIHESRSSTSGRLLPP